MSDDPTTHEIFAARIVPHRSLTRRSFRLLLMMFAAAGFFTSLPLVAMGAWPIAGFMGADVALFYLAFRANYRAARAYEDVSVTPLELVLAKVSPRGARREWRFNPTWTRLERREHEEFGLQHLSLVSRGRSVEVAAFLGPDEKAAFARDLSRALSEARRGPQFS